MPLSAKPSISTPLPSPVWKTGPSIPPLSHRVRPAPCADHPRPNPAAQPPPPLPPPHGRKSAAPPLEILPPPKQRFFPPLPPRLQARRYPIQNRRRRRQMARARDDVRRHDSEAL